MKDKKVYSVLIIATLILALTVTAIPTMADEFHSVYGDLTINNKQAPTGTEVKLSF